MNGIANKIFIAVNCVIYFFTKKYKKRKINFEIKKNVVVDAD